jgi:hypothetical protein
MMVVISKIHQDMRINFLGDNTHSDSFIDETIEKIKIGDIIDSSSVLYIQETPKLNVRNHRASIKLIRDFYDTAEILYNNSLHSADIEWCVYRSGKPWDNMVIGATRTSPIFLSTSTSIEFVSLWKQTENVLFKIILPGDTKLIVIEDIFNPQIDKIEDTSFEYEITIPPGTFTIQNIQNIIINNIQRTLITTHFSQLSKEQALSLLESIS